MTHSYNEPKSCKLDDLISISQTDIDYKRYTDIGYNERLIEHLDKWKKFIFMLFRINYPQKNPSLPKYGIVLLNIIASFIKYHE